MVGAASTDVVDIDAGDGVKATLLEGLSVFRLLWLVGVWLESGLLGTDMLNDESVEPVEELDVVLTELKAVSEVVDTANVSELKLASELVSDEIVLTVSTGNDVLGNESNAVLVVPDDCAGSEAVLLVESGIDGLPLVVLLVLLELNFDVADAVEPRGSDDEGTVGD